MQRPCSNGVGGMGGRINGDGCSPNILGLYHFQCRGRVDPVFQPQEAMYGMINLYCFYTKYLKDLVTKILYSMHGDQTGSREADGYFLACR